jgi:chemotaxis response regulator CheB
MTPSGGQRPHLPVDHLFRSLAEDQGHSAIGVVLSGTGTDGTLGLKGISAAGGFSFCQEPSTAKFDGMPRVRWAILHFSEDSSPDQDVRTGICEFFRHDSACDTSPTY